MVETSNILCGICSFFIPGLGQLLQGRVCAFFVHFMVALLVGLITLGILSLPMALFSAYDASTSSKQEIKEHKSEDKTI